MVAEHIRGKGRYEESLKIVDIFSVSFSTPVLKFCCAWVKSNLSRVSRQSRLSAEDNADNKMVSGAVHRSLGIYFTSEENPWKLIYFYYLFHHRRPIQQSCFAFL